MAANTELMDFVATALARGASREGIQETLLEAGWSRDMVADALAGYADVDFPVPVPRPRRYVSPRDAFTYLLLFGTLCVTAFNAGALIFGGINHAFPDPAMPPASIFVREQIRWSLSAVLVASPVFFFLSAAVERRVRRDPVERRSQVRRALMYLTVLIAAAVLIGDVITLVYNALGGELTVRFVLKALAVGAIAGTIFSYYLSDVRLEDAAVPITASRRTQVAGMTAIAGTVAVVVLGLWLIGSPSAERARRLDARRTQDLERISQSVNVYFQRQHRLPASLAELSREGGLGIPFVDGAGHPYEYRAMGDRVYELCASFDRDSADEGRGSSVDVWAHAQGRQCFPRQIKDGD